MDGVLTQTRQELFPARAPEGRLLSLDVLRGITIAAMILVNNPGDWGSVYGPLLHASWHGCTFTDLIFPCFLWIVGVAIPLSTRRRLERGQSRRELMLHAVRRSVILFALGLFLNSFGFLFRGWDATEGAGGWCQNYLTHVRIPGVLQRIAICYFVATAVFLWVQQRWTLVAIAGLLLGYWGLMSWVPVPGFGPGVLENQGNLAQYLDNLLLNGPFIGTHVWQTSKTWDPEGVLSTLPAIATCLFGVLAGHLLGSDEGRTVAEKAAWLFAAGNSLMALGLLWSPLFPMNKSLWTSSYAVFSSGVATVAFALCYWFLDCRRPGKWHKPFAIHGLNAITVFVVSGILGRLLIEIRLSDSAGEVIALKSWIYRQLFAPFGSVETASWLGPFASPRNASLLWAILFSLLMYAVSWIMYRRRWFVRF